MASVLILSKTVRFRETGSQPPKHFEQKEAAEPKEKQQAISYVLQTANGIA